MKKQQATLAGELTKYNISPFENDMLSGNIAAKIPNKNVIREDFCVSMLSYI